MNLHGRVGLATSMLAVAGGILGYVLVGVLHVGLLGSALAIAVPLTIGNGVFLAVYASRKLELPVSAYAVALRTPVMCSAPFALVLIATRLMWSGAPLETLMVGVASGAAVLAPSYWMFALPLKVRQRVLDTIPWFVRVAADGPISGAHKGAWR
jgi:hypothetical protein